MEIRNLAATTPEQLVEAILAAFEGYFVPMPADVNYWVTRFKGARVNFELSFGVFDNDQLVAFIIHGIDFHNGIKTAFNTGTGVIPAYRNRQLVSRLYDFALPLLRENGVGKCMLEVITANEKAIRVYEQIGFRNVRKLHCFRGTLQSEPAHVRLQKILLETVLANNEPFRKWYSWDHSNEALQQISSSYETYEVSRSTEPACGYFIINPQSGYLARFEITGPENDADYDLLLGGIALLKSNIRTNNLDAARTGHYNALLRNGLENHIDQFEMERLL